MARSTAPKFVIHIPGVHGGIAWREKAKNGIPGYGRPTSQNLKAFIEGFVASLQPGGCNQHLGIEAAPKYAAIQENCLGGAIVAEWKA